MYDDNYATNTYYAAVGGVDAEELKQLELVFMVQIEWRVFIKEHSMVLLRSQLMNFSYNFDTQQYTFKKGYLAKKLTKRGSMLMPPDPQETQEMVKKMKKMDKKHKSKSLTA